MVKQITFHVAKPGKKSRAFEIINQDGTTRTGYYWLSMVRVTRDCNSDRSLVVFTDFTGTVWTLVAEKVSIPPQFINIVVTEECTDLSHFA